MQRINYTIMNFILFLSLSLSAGWVWSKSLKVVTTSTDLESLAKTIGGERVEAQSLASPKQDLHFVDAKPSLILKLMKADLFIENGMELEVGWAPLLVHSSGNPLIQAGAQGHLDASAAIEALDVPLNPNRAMGDVHPAGNPHYLTDPENGKRVAQLISNKLCDFSPNDAEYFKQNLAGFDKKMDLKIREWIDLMAPYRGVPYVSYHKDVAYFAKRFGLNSVGEIEPKPGIPPTAQHTADLISRMQTGKIKLIITQLWHEPRTPESIAKNTGAKIFTFIQFPGGVEAARDYIGAVDYNVHQILNLLSGSAGETH